MDKFNEVGSKREKVTPARLKRLMAQMLLRDSAQDTPALIDAGPIKISNWGAILGKAVDRYRGEKMAAEADAAEAEEAKAFDARRAAALQQFAQDTTDQTIEPGPTQDGTGRETVKADLKRAYLNAMQSGDPGMGAVGEAGLKEWQKGQITPTDVLSKYSELDPNSPMVRSALPGAMPSPKMGVADGKAYALQFGPQGLQTQSAPISQFAQETVNGIYGNRDKATNEFKAVGTSGSVTPPAAKVRSKIDDAKIGEITDKFQEKKTRLLEGGQNLADLQTQIEKMDPTSFSWGANWKVGVNKLASMLGVSLDPKLVEQAQRIEAGNSILGERMIERIRMLAPVTEDDVQRMQKIVGDFGANTKGALEAIIAYAMSKVHQQIEQHNDAVAGVEGREGYENIDTYYIGNEPRDKPGYNPRNYMFIGRDPIKSAPKESRFGKMTVSP